MQDVYIIEAVRSPIGKRGKGLAGLMPADLLGAVQLAALKRAGLDGNQIGQVIGGCVSQVGEQSFNIARVAWLSAGLPLEVASTTVDSQCGSSQQATSFGAAMVGAGLEDVVMSCGVEMMTRVPLGSNMKGGVPMGASYMSHYQPTSQFMGAAMIAEEYQITREDTDAFGLRSQQRAIARVGSRPLRPRSRRRSPRRCSTKKANRPARRRRSRATKVCARPRWKRCARSSRFPGRAFTPPAAARRYPTAPPR